jgi:hypothetical protein
VWSAQQQASRFAYLLIDADYGIRGLLFADQVFVDL